MPTVAEKITIASPPEEVWPLLSDPTLVASCIPGATLAPDQGGGDVWKGSIRVKFGPTVAVFRGEATLTYDHTNRRCTIEGRGIDQRGASRALANGEVSATGTTETELAVQGEYTVSGPLETFANAGGVHVARALLAEFAKNMGTLAAERRGSAPTAASAPSSEPAPSPAATTPAAPPAASAPGTPASQQPAPQPRQAAELNAFALLWAAFKSWLSSLFGKRS
jgi:carbon monoxide dehydrogenase subunit G